MDEEVINDLYNRAKSKGYQKSLEEFVSLLHSDQEVFNDMYGYVQSKGYKKGTEGFSALIGKTQQQPAQQQTTQIQSLTQQQTVKKKELSASLLEGGFSDFLKSEQPQQEYKPTTPIPGTDYNTPQKGPIQPEVEGDDVWYKKGREEKLKELKKYENYQPEYITDEFGNRVKAMQPIAREENLTQPLQKIEQKVKYEEEAKKIQEAAPEEIKSTLKYLDLSKDKSLPDFVSDANYYFNDAGFEFKDAGYNYIEITSPDGEVIQFKYNLGGKEDVENTMAQINNILLKKSAKLKDIYGLDRMYKDENKKFATQYQIDSEFSMLAKEQEALVQQTTTFLKRKQEAEAALKAVNELPMDKRTANYRNDKFQAEQNLKAIYTEAEELQKKIDAIPIKQKNLEIALGKYTSKQEKQGTWVGGIYNSLLSFLDNTVAGSTDIFIDLKTGFIPVKTQLGAEEYEKRVKLYAAELGIDANKVLLPEEYMSKLTDPEKRGAVLDAKVLKEKIDAKIRDDIRKKEKYGTEDELTFMEAMRNGFRTAFGDKSTTEQWEALTKKSFVGGAVLGAAEFVPTMFVPGAWVRRAATYASVNDMVNQEFENNPELRDVSEAEKLYVKIPIGIVGAVLEEYGLKNIIQNTALVKSITGRALLKATEGMTPAVFKKLVSSEVSEMIADGTLKVLGGGIMEFETGAAQQGVDIAVKSIYNASKGKKLFDTPDTVVEVAVDMAVAGAQESIGSVAISTPMVVASAYRKKDIAGIPAEFFDVFVESANDQNIEKGFIATLKNDITAGKITQKEAVDLLNNYRNSVGLLRSVPPELDNADKKKAMTLLRERKELESKTDGKDPALVKPIQERINKINEQLSKLTEDAIQKQTTGEVSVQPEAGAGQEVEVGGPEAKPQITAEESKRKEDLLAALEATDKDVIAIGDELLDRKEAQAEIEAITQKEQPAPVEGLGTQLEAVAKEVIPTKEEAPVQPAEKKPLNFAIGGTSRGYRVWQSGQKVEEGSVESKDPRELLRNSETTEITPEGSKTKIIGRIAEVREGGKVAYYAIAQDAKFDEGQSFTRLKDFVGRGGPISVMLSFNESDNVSMDDVKAALVEKLTEVVDKSVDKTTFQTNKPADLGTFEFAITPKATETVATPATEVTPTETTPTPTETTATEVTPVEQQFTEQDRARKAELEEAMRKADKRRKNITVGETTMPKAEAKAELDALNQKEQATQQPVTPAVEAAPTVTAPTATAPVETMTAEQEADLLEELMTGKKKETAPVETAPTTPTAEPVVTETATETAPVVEEGVAEEAVGKPKGKKLSDTIRGLEIKGPGGLQSNLLGVPIAILNSAIKTTAAAIDAGVAISKAIQQGAKEIKNWIKENNPSLSLSDAKIKNKILIDLYEGTIKTARENNVKTEGLITYFKRKGLSDAQIDVLLKDEKKKAEKPELSEETLPGYTKLMNRINDIIARGRRNGKTDDDIMKGVIANVESRSPEYANATDQQREQIIRDIRKLFGKKEKAAPSAAKITGKPKPKKVTVDEMTALKDQLRLEAKAAREAKGDLNTKRKMLADAINKMVKKGSVTVRQAKALINKVNSVNLDNPVMVERLLDYAEKVFNDAEYADKLSQAKKLQSTAKSLSGNKEKNPEVRELAKKFAEIDPALVENIDEYIEMASAVVEGLKGSKLTAKGVSLAAAVDINETSKYIEKALEYQAEKQKQMMADKMQSLMGVDVSDLTYDQLLELLDDSSKPIDKYKETIIRDIINKMFDTYSGIIESMLETGKDPFDISEDAETIEFKDSTKQVVRNFMSIDLNSLSPREALKAVDALNNFIVNGSTANMETVYNTYLANKNAKEVKQKGVKGKKLTFFFVPSLGRMLLDEFASLPLLLESMFKSTNVALYFSKMSGLSNLMNGAARATTITQKTISRYLDAFSKLKPNGKAFNDAYNATERGMVAFMSRNLIGSEAKMKKEFNDRKSLVEKSIEELSKGTAKEQEKAKLYQEAYDKILDGSDNAQQVKDKAAKENVEAVDWWINEWSKHIDELSDVSLNVYNKVLDRELNYTTDRYSKLELATKDESVLDSNASAYHFNNGTMYKKEAGALKETTDKTGELPKNKDGEVTRYVDLSFDSIQASSLYDAMADIKTAGAIRQVDAFFKSKDTRSLFSAEDFKLLDERVKLAIRNIRNQQSYDNGEIEKLVKALDKFAKYSASIALAGVTQPFKQTVPLMFNTLINAGQFDPFGVTFNSSIKDFIDESGRAIANRGVESQVYIESINRLIDQAAKSKGEAALKLIEQANDLWMKVFLANPDRYIARASWMAYYEQSLKKQGISTKGIDYAKHELNEDAADYAQMMVDRQQNITDTKLAGRMYSDTEGGSWKKILTRMLLPLASFRLNQFIRAKSDTATFFSKTTTLQDKTKSARSLSGMAAEMLVFKSMVIGFGLTWHYISDAILAAMTGDEEDEKESEKKWKERFNNLVKGQATSAVTDLFSPIPILDPFVKYGANTALDVTQNLLKVADNDKFKLFVDDPKKVKTYSDAAGMYGIGIDKINEIIKTSKLAITGKFIDDEGRERFIKDEQRQLLSWSIIPSVIFNAGLLPGAPEFNNIMGKIKSNIKYSGMTEKQMDVYKKTGLDKDEIKRSKEKALKGYSSEKQFEENNPEGYLKAVEDGTIYDYRKQNENIRIATGEMSPEQLYKVSPTLWKKKYGPGTDYYKQQRTPAARKKARKEERYKAEVKAEAEAVEAKKQREEARKKRRY